MFSSVPRPIFGRQGYHSGGHISGVLPLPGVLSLGVPGGTTALPDFGRSVNPISTREKDYAHLITTGTPGFFRPSDGPAATAAFYSSKSRQGLASHGGFGVESTSQVAETIKFLPWQQWINVNLYGEISTFYVFFNQLHHSFESLTSLLSCNCLKDV